MTYAPGDLLNVRGYLIRSLDLLPGIARGVDLEAAEVGIVGDPAHAATGGYHEGNDDLARVGRLSSDYSKRESVRDRPGTNAASALDIGWFDVDRAGRRITLRTLSAAIVAACRQGDPRVRDIREVIWSPDGSVVQRWDRLGVRSTGDSSHRTHTHLSFFRDSEGRRDRSDNVFGLLSEIIGGEDVLTNDDIKAITQNVASAVRRGVWMGGYNDASFDPPYRGGQTLDTIGTALADLRLAVGASGAAVNTIVPAVSAAMVVLDVEPSEEQIEAIAAALRDAPDVPLGAEDVPEIVAGVRKALRDRRDAAGHR